MRILSVDDCPTTRKYIKRVIELLGFEFLEATDGKDGLNVIEQQKGQIDLILLDRHMPVMDGKEMLQALKSNKLYKYIPVTMVTVEAAVEEIQSAINIGATNYLIKPFSQEDLTGKILEVLKIET